MHRFVHLLVYDAPCICTISLIWSLKIYVYYCSNSIWKHKCDFVPYLIQLAILQESHAFPCAKGKHGKRPKPHGKMFVVCHTRQITYGIQASAKRIFIVDRFSGRRQNLCRVLFWLMAKMYTRQNLNRKKPKTIGKKKDLYHGSFLRHTAKLLLCAVLAHGKNVHSAKFE